MEHTLTQLVEALGEALRGRGRHAATAESCTGGLIAGELTAVAGSSDWFLGGVVAYANSAKQVLLGVEAATLAAHGAVSEPVVRAMARGARRALGADLAVAVSGVAGPGGGTPEKPVGTVWLGWSWATESGGDGEAAVKVLLPGDRAAVRAATVRRAIEGLLAVARGEMP